MQVHRRGSKILIFGQSGFGKTTYLIRHALNVPVKTIFIFDHKLEFLARENIEPYYNSEEMVDGYLRGEKIISYNGLEEYSGDDDAAFDFFCRWVYNVCRATDAGEHLFVCDEVNSFTSCYDFGQSFNNLIKDGRLWGVDFAGTAHAGNQVNNRLRMQLSEIISFRIQDESATKFLKSCGFDTEELQDLEVGEFIAKNCFTSEFSRGHLFKLTSSREKTNPRDNEISQRSCSVGANRRGRLDSVQNGDRPENGLTPPEKQNDLPETPTNHPPV